MQRASTCEPGRKVALRGRDAHAKRDAKFLCKTVDTYKNRD